MRKNDTVSCNSGLKVMQSTSQLLKTNVVSSNAICWAQMLHRWNENDAIQEKIKGTWSQHEFSPGMMHRTEAISHQDGLWMGNYKEFEITATCFTLVKCHPCTTTTRTRGGLGNILWLCRRWKYHRDNIMVPIKIQHKRMPGTNMDKGLYIYIYIILNMVM